MAGHHGNRWGRSEAARAAVLEAADDLLVERGFAGVTIEGIAARAGVAKQTIYRWWASKTDILLEAFVTDAAEALEPPDTGDLAEDLRRHLAGLAEFLTRSDAGAVFRALVGEAQHDARLAARLRDDVLVRHRERDRLPFERAAARGELHPEADTALLTDLLVSPLHHRALVTGEPLDTPYTDALVRTVLATVATSRSA